MGTDATPGPDPAAGPVSGTGGEPRETTVTVQFRPDLVALWVAGGPAPPLLVDLGDQLVESGFALRPLHPGTADRDLAAWFEVVAPDPESAQRALAQLRGHPAVVAAIVKPPDAPP